jgi:hypothetical protein
MSNKTYINNSGKKVLEYDTTDSIVLDLPFIMTRNKRLIKNMPYMKLEKLVAGNDIAAIRLLDFEDADGVINLNVQELATNKTYSLSWNIEFDGDYWLWALADFDYLQDLAMKRGGTTDMSCCISSC